MRRLGMADADSAAEVLARAFMRDPLWQYLIPNLHARIPVLRQSFRATVPLYAANRQVYGYGDPLDSVAIWRAPGQRTRGVRALLNPSALSLVFSPFVGIFNRAIPIFTQFDRMHAQYVSGLHFYLSTIGVVPDAQGRGRASQLIKPILEQADAQRRGVYTETMTPSNVPLYEHYGFVCQERFEVPGTRLNIWSFYRPA